LHAARRLTRVEGRRFRIKKTLLPGGKFMRFLRFGLSLREAGVAAGSGILSALSFPPFGLWPLALAGVALFLWPLRQAGAEKARSLGLVYGLVYGLGTM
jgi:apolipoprotein N-acyltransferase